MQDARCQKLKSQEANFPRREIIVGLGSTKRVRGNLEKKSLDDQVLYQNTVKQNSTDGIIALYTSSTSAMLTIITSFHLISLSISARFLTRWACTTIARWVKKRGLRFPFRSTFPSLHREALRFYRLPHPESAGIRYCRPEVHGFGCRDKQTVVIKARYEAPGS